MFFLLELLASAIRIMLLFFGAIFTFLLGEHVYRYINDAVFAYAVPCMEMLSFIIAVIGPIAYFTGIYHQKGFFQRKGSYNKCIFLLSFIFGAVVTFLPVTGAQVTNAVCTQQISLLAQILQSIMTGILTAFIAYLSFDVGVYQARYLSPLLRNQKLSKKKKKR